MIDQDVAYLNSLSVYRILRENNLLRRRKSSDRPPKWNLHERLSGPDEVWQTDLMVIRFNNRNYYSLTYFVYSRFVVYNEICMSMTGDSIHQASQRAVAETGKKPSHPIGQWQLLYQHRISINWKIKKQRKALTKNLLKCKHFV